MPVPCGWQVDSYFQKCMGSGAFFNSQDFSGYSTLETYISEYYDESNETDDDIDFFIYEPALTAVIKQYYLINHPVMFEKISKIIGYDFPPTKYDAFLNSIEFFSNLSPVYSLVQHQLYFPPYNLSARLSKQLIQDVMASGIY